MSELVSEFTKFIILMQWDNTLQSTSTLQTAHTVHKHINTTREKWENQSFYAHKSEQYCICLSIVVQNNRICNDIMTREDIHTLCHHILSISCTKGYTRITKDFGCTQMYGLRRSRLKKHAMPKMKKINVTI